MRQDVPVSTEPGAAAEADTDASTSAGSSVARERRRLDAARAARARVRKAPGGSTALKVGVFLLGLAFILLGLALIVAPGPLTIPPILVGLYIWSTEFAWADRLLDRAKDSARDAWETAKRKPVSSAVVTGGGLLALGVGIYLVGRFDLISQATRLVGL